MKAFLTTPASAKLAGEKYYFTGVPCPRGHVANRRASNAACVACEKEKQAERCKCVPQKVKDSALKYYHKNKVTLRRKALEYHHANKKRRSAYLSQWKHKNRDKYTSTRRTQRASVEGRAASRRYYAERRAKIHSELHKCSKEELLAIKSVYKKASKMGEGFHVDHIVPLSRGGPHRIFNLRIISKEDNLMKSAELCIEGYL